MSRYRIEYEWDCMDCPKKNVRVLNHEHDYPSHRIIRGKGKLIENE